MLVTASAPGSMMLLGEYAVLQGKQALVCAINQRITVKLTPRTDKKIKIISALGNHEVELSELKVQAPFQFILTILKKFSTQLPQGCDLIIESDFSEKIGLGSSAAVTVATLSAIKQWLNIENDPQELIADARAIIREVQGLGSGADVAASVLGGLVAYQADPLNAEKISTQHPITAIYSGYKTTTVEAVKQVENNFHGRADDFKNLCQAIGTCAEQGVQAAREKNWENLGKIMNAQQDLMDSLGVATPDLTNIVTTLRTSKNILGAKISGSGLGDCIIGLGSATHFTNTNEKIKCLDISMSPQGVICEKI